MRPVNKPKFIEDTAVGPSGCHDAVFPVLAG
jgi:hypothetical protein